MPFYEYVCDFCGPFEASRSMALAAEPHDCPDCDRLAPRAISSPHVRTPRARIHYSVEARNEKSANEPAVEHRLNGTRKKHIAHAKKAQVRAHQNHRPWMIGH